MDPNQVGSLAETFLKDPNAKTAYKTANPTSKNVNNYIFSVDLVHENICCGMDNQCDWFQATAEDRNSDDLRKLVLCITCDRVYHIRCTGSEFESLPENQLPWICHKCKANPMNPSAQMVVAEGKFKESFDQRVKHFIKNSSAVDESSSSDSEDEDLNQTIHVDNNLNHIPASFLEQFQKLTKKYEKAVQKNKRLYETIKNHQKESNPAILQNLSAVESIDASSNPSRAVTGSSSSHKPRDSNTTYTNAIMNANAASTQIDIEINRSGLQQNSLLNSAITAVEPPIASQSDATLQHINALTLHEIRKSLPKIETFDGKPEKWLTFQRAVDRNWKEGRYSDELMKLHIRQALSGQALARVDSLMDMMTAMQIIEFLKESYGNSNVIVEQARQKLLNVKLTKPLSHSACVEVTTLIAGYMSACSYAGLLVADSSISTRIHQQLESYHQQMYYEYYFKKYPNATTRVERLDIQFEFLNSISKTLPLGTFKSDENRQNRTKGNYQVMLTSVDTSHARSQARNSKSQSSRTESYKYEIKDKDTAKYLGYDMTKVREINKKCEVCGRNSHYTVECSTYRDMRMDDKYTTVKSKGLCLNCLLTSSHSAKDCEIKLCCGLKLDKNSRCTAKHHITLHRSNFNNQRRSYYNQNAHCAEDKSKNHSLSQQNNEQLQTQQSAVTNVSNFTPSVSSPSNLSQNLGTVAIATCNEPKPYQQLVISTSQSCNSQSSNRTVKLFKTLFHSNKGKAIGYSLGDSGSEITLVRKDLVDDLGITGQPCILNLQWADSEVKSIRATKVKLRISGVERLDEVLEMDECYAIENLALTSRSLNVDELKRKFSYLQDVPFESYQNAIPSVLIGSRHAYMVEAVEPIVQGGNCKPIGIKTKLGYTIYGGAPECFEATHAVNIHQVDKVTAIPVHTDNRNAVSSVFKMDYKHIGIQSSIGSPRPAIMRPDFTMSSTTRVIRPSNFRKESVESRSSRLIQLKRPSLAGNLKTLQFCSSSTATSHSRRSTYVKSNTNNNYRKDKGHTQAKFIRSIAPPSSTSSSFQSMGVIAKASPENKLNVYRPKRKEEPKKKRFKSSDPSGMDFDKCQLTISEAVKLKKLVHY